jgi:hypothetical protein
VIGTQRIFGNNDDRFHPIDVTFFAVIWNETPVPKDKEIQVRHDALVPNDDLRISNGVAGKDKMTVLVYIHLITSSGKGQLFIDRIQELVAASFKINLLNNTN